MSRATKWNNINKTLGLTTIAFLFSAIMSLMWNGETEAWLLIRLGVSVGIPAFVSWMVYIGVYFETIKD